MIKQITSDILKSGKIRKFRKPVDIILINEIQVLCHQYCKQTSKEIMKANEDFRKRRGVREATNIINPEMRWSNERHDYWVKVLSMPISHMKLSARAQHIMEKANVATLLDLVAKIENDIRKIRNCGSKTIQEIKLLLHNLDLQLGEPLTASLLQDIQTYKESMGTEEIVCDFRHCYHDKCSFLGKAKISRSNMSRFTASRIKFMKKCFDAYLKYGTLASVAKRMSLTRERIRQILIQGTRIGLFNYTGKNYAYVEKNKIIDDYLKYPSLSSVAKINNVTVSYLKRMLTAYKITEKDIEVIRKNSYKDKCIKSYRQIESKLGHPPTTTELQRKSGWRYLSMRISHLWGSIDAFREELQIPKPVRTFPEASRKWQETRKRVAFIIRMQNLDSIREYINKRSPVGSTEIACECNINSPKTLRLLNLLLARGEILRTGHGSGTKYILSQKQAPI